VTDPPDAWAALGFDLVDGCVALEGVSIRSGDARAVALAGFTGEDLDGVPVLEAPEPVAAVAHPNGVYAVDHFVIVSPDFDRTVGALAAGDIELSRIRDAGGFRQGFRRLGPVILELVEAKQMPPGPARFWGLTLVADDLDALAAQLGRERLRPIKDAVQSRRRIATLDRAAGLRTNVAFMDPER
jgi:hypothetical protein